MLEMATLQEKLKKHVDGDIHFDAVHKKVYSVDASIYEVEPIGIVLPKNKQALVTALQIAKEFQIPVIPRGAATGITGGCLGNGLIIDTSKYLNRILEINYENEYAVCEPGVVQDHLNEELSNRGYRLGPDTSTGNRATIGGMLANNAAGSRSLRFGTMADHTEAVELILASSEKLHFKSINEQEYQRKCQQQNTEGHIYREIDRIQNEYRQDIEAHFPKIPRRVSGYNLDALLKPGPLNLSRLIAGSEGSLGIATEITVKICKKPKITGLCILLFEDMIEGMKSIETLLKHNPMAIEMIDHHIIEMAERSPSMRGKLDWLTGKPEAIFAAEFEGENPKDLSEKLSRFANDMVMRKIGYGHTVLIDPTKMSHLWEVRKSGLGLLLSKRDYSRAIAFLEDITVGPPQLASFMEKFQNYLRSKNKEAGVYGHVGSGCMHVRPYIDLRQSNEVKLMEQMMIDISDLLLEHGGALSGEHGDGRIRTWLNKKMFGDRVYQAFVEIKKAFDPENRMNPGKVVHGFPLLEDLRLSPTTPIHPIDTFLDFSREGGFELAVDLCNGNGMCRKSEKVMCPSFQATGDEFHTTRARAQALRSIIHGRLPMKDLTSQGLYDVLDLCLECKGCKTECPSEVDMAKMKAEFLYHYQKAHGTSLRSRLFSSIGQIYRMGSFSPSLFNYFNESQFGKILQHQVGIASQRTLPPIAHQRFSSWFAKSATQQKYKKKVVLFNDTFTEFNQPEIGRATLQVLNAMGFSVIVPPWKCCGRPALSKGQLKKAKNMAASVVDLLLPYAEIGIPIIGIEPSCLLTIKDDFEGLIGSKNRQIQILANACMTLDEFLANHVENNALPLELKEQKKPIKVHGHCHQKAIISMEPTLKVLRTIPGSQVSEIPSGCCGLAGSFGYEEEHYDLSMKIGELHLFPAIRKTDSDTIIVADGMSCRNQIAHGTKQHAHHLAEVIASLL